MQQLLDHIAELGIGELATVVGRYYIMDRDKRWDRVEIGMKGVVTGEGEESSDAVKTITERYEKGENDEFLKPIIFGGTERRVQGRSTVSPIAPKPIPKHDLTDFHPPDNDTLFFFNYRSDRVREITQLLGQVDTSPKPDFPYPSNLHITTMTQYKTDYPFPIAFPPQHMGNVLAEWLGKQDVKQCHVAETEKYAHVTFFFNGGVEKQFAGEEREMIASPKVATYDLEPKMSAKGVADKLSERIASGKFEFLMNNFAPPDMVGHTGVYDAAVVACTETDRAIGDVYETCKKEGYVLFITSDHG
jgi:2,3-bisphosphoglycerate-independent phosphoglycerate mutase